MFESRKTILNLDQTLRRLHLSINPMYLNLEIFNSLVQLEQLEIENVSIVNCTPTLPNLKIFKFLPRSRNQQIKLQAPKLEVLYYNDPYGIELDRPETIKHLRTENFHNIMDVFKNLEILECGQIRYVNKEILSLFRNLKVLSGYETGEKLKTEEHRSLVDKMSFIMEQRLILGRTELKIYLQVVQLTDDTNLDDFKSDLKNNKFQIENYANLYSSLHFIRYVNYSQLTRLMKQVSDDYFSKFCQIRSVEVKTKVNRDHFIWFASRLNFVGSLTLTNASLDQSMIDNLLVGFSDLLSLIINEAQELNLNFDCILKCKRLIYFKTNQSFQNSFDLAIQAFSRLTELGHFIFKKDDETVKIRRDLDYTPNGYRPIFNLICGRRGKTPSFSRDGLELNELVTYCNQLANKTGVRTGRSTKLTKTTGCNLS